MTATHYAKRTSSVRCFCVCCFAHLCLRFRDSATTNCRHLTPHTEFSKLPVCVCVTFCRRWHAADTTRISFISTWSLAGVWRRRRATKRVREYVPCGMHRAHKHSQARTLHSNIHTHTHPYVNSGCYRVDVASSSSCLRSPDALTKHLRFDVLCPLCSVHQFIMFFFIRDDCACAHKHKKRRRNERLESAYNICTCPCGRRRRRRCFCFDLCTVFGCVDVRRLFVRIVFVCSDTTHSLYAILIDRRPWPKMSTHAFSRTAGQSRARFGYCVTVARARVNNFNMKEVRVFAFKVLRVGQNSQNLWSLDMCCG